MTPVAEEPVWDAVLRPRLTPIFAVVAAIVIALAHIVVGFLLTVRSSGVIFQTADQVAIGALGVVIGGAVLLFTRPRLRIGPQGISVRNLLGDKLVSWPDVKDVSFHEGARWARLDLPDDEYVPVMAIQQVDKVRAVESMETVRTLMVKYGAGG
ncbi:PH domain-containing protein [[Mycobacterium] burgundiense]|uniref:PH domain-containing protein n=1 Tax=[Mycobacterium] burgundiense TaxID=3064286 RepID=UPI00359FAE3C